MKMRKILFTLAAALLSVALLAGCGGKAEEGKTERSTSPETANAEPANVESKDAEKPEEAKAEETVNTYTEESGMYSITLPGDWTEDGNMGMSGILSLSRSDGAGAVVMGVTKSQMAGAGVESLSDFFDFADSSLLNGAASNTTLTDTEAIPLEGFGDMIAKEGTMTQTNGASGKLFVQCAETGNAYYLIMLSTTSGYDELIASVRDNMSFEELTVSAPDALPDTLRWFNGTYAVITTLNGGDLNLVAGYEPGEMIEELEQQLLDRDWGVTDRESLDETIDWLLTEGHNQEVLDTMIYIEADGKSRDDIMALMDEYDFDDGERVMTLAAYDAWTVFGDNAIAGWDLSRAMSLMGWGYLAGYYTYEEAMDKSLETAQMIQQTFGSWDEFMASYMLGYSYWSEEDLDDPDSRAYERLGVYEELANDPVGVFSVDWNTTLTKEW